MRKWHEGMDEVRKLRQDGKSLNEICQVTGASRATAYGWIKDMPVPLVDGIDIRTRAKNSKYWSQETIKKRVEAFQKGWADKRQTAYETGKQEAEELLRDRHIRDFVCLYIGEGSKKQRGTVSVVNTDPKIICLCAKVLGRYTNQKMWYRLFCSEEEKDKLMKFWSEVLGLETGMIRFQLKKQVSKRRAEYGLVSVGTSDTYFRSRLQAWMDRIREDW